MSGSMRIAVLAAALLVTVATSAAGHRPARRRPTPRAPVGIQPAQGDAGVPAAPGPSFIGPPISSGGQACVVDSDCRPPGRGVFFGRCFTPGMAAQYTQAFRDCPEGRAWRDTHSPGTCVIDECRDSTARGGDTCGPGRRCGTLDMVPFPQRVCVSATCENDLQCRREVFGRCAGYIAAGHCQRGGWACSYPSDPCAPRDSVRMCPVQTGMLGFCSPQAGRFSCVQEPVVCTPGQ